MTIKFTKRVFFWSFVSNAPFWAMYNILPFILYELGASAFQITLMVSLKPMVSLLSVYWGAHIHNRPERIVPNLISTTLLSHLPFVFLPWINNPWYIIAAASVYMMLERGAKPAWMELLKRNLESTDRQNFFSKVASTSYLSSGVFPILFGILMDGKPGSWRWIFPIVSLISIIPIFLQRKLVIQQIEGTIEDVVSIPWWRQMSAPWIKSWELIQENGDFRLFQIGFFLGGAGVMIMQPALPEYFMEHLHLSYTELLVALTLCKGIGFALTSPSWARWMNRVNIFSLGSLVPFVMIIVALLMIGAKFWTPMFYLAYLFYGIMQAGSELTWHLSGLNFAKEKDSSLYTGVSVVLVGVRGLFAPALGLWAMSSFGTMSPMIAGALLCLASTLVMLSKAQKSKQALETA